MNKKFNCSLCGKFAAIKFLPVLRHIGEVHQYEPGFQVKCGLDDCQKLYQSFSSYRSHMYKKHRSFVLGELDTSLPPMAREEESTEL